MVKLTRWWVVAPDRVWAFLGEDGTKYYTDSGWRASLLKHAVETATPIEFGSNAGLTGRWVYSVKEPAA